MQYVPMPLDSTTKISSISALRNAIVLYENDQRAQLWRRGEKKSSVVDGCDLFDMQEIMRDQIRSSVPCNTFAFTDDGDYLFGVSQRDSSLFMYEISDAQCLGKLYIENLSPLMKISNDRVILSRKNELVMLSITAGNQSSCDRWDITECHTNWRVRVASFRLSDLPPHNCALFEDNEWLDYHSGQCWVETTSACSDEQGENRNPPVMLLLTFNPS